MAAIPQFTHPIELLVNGANHRLTVGGSATLLQVLRNDLGLNGPKYGCGLGQCGACTVHVDVWLLAPVLFPPPKFRGGAIPPWRA